MAVTIVSSLPKPTPVKAADTTAEASAGNAPASDVSGADFASLLVGQLAPVMPQALPEDPAQAELPATDAVSMLATLGIVPPIPAQGAASALSGSGKVDTTASANPLTPLQNSGQSLKAEGKTEPATTELALGVTLTADEKPAKFAAALSGLSAAPLADTVSGKAAASESTPNNLAAITNTLHGNATNPVHNRETSLTLPSPLHSPAWTSDFGQKILWLASNDKQTAQLTLNPPQIGPIEISLNVEKGTASASFVSANADVREAIETALPRLREMFASAGIELGQTNVSAESFKQQAGGSGENRGASQWMGDNAILVADLAGSLTAGAFATQRGSGTVDIFA